MNLKETFFPDHFSQGSRIGVITGVLVSSLSLIALLNIKPINENRYKKTIARIEKFSSSVRLKGTGSASFYDVTLKEELQNSDEIFTGENSSALVRFIKSNTVLKIPSSSLVRIEESESGDIVEVKDGLVDIIIAKNQEINLKVNGEVHQIKAVEDNSSIKAYYSEGELQLVTEAKGIKVKDDKGERKLTSNVTVALAKKIESIKPVIIKIKPFNLLAPVSGQKFNALDGIAIATDPKADYKVNLSKDAKATEPVLSSNFTGNDFVWKTTFNDGDYFLNVSDSKTTRTVPIIISTVYDVTGFKPAEEEIINVTFGQKSILSWNPLNVKSYKVIVQNAQGISKEYITKNNQLELENLSGPEIKWSVNPELAGGSYYDSKKYIHNNLKYDGKIEFINLTKKDFKITETQFNVSWTAPLAEKFDIHLINLATNKEILHTQTKVKKLTIPLNSVGSFKLSVSSIDLPDLGVSEFTYTTSGPILSWDSTLPKELSSTEEDETILLKYSSKLDLKRVANIHQKYFPINGTPVIKVLKIEEASQVKLVGFGQYCYIGHLISPLEHYYDSELYCFKLTQLPVFTTIPQPKDSILTNIKKDGIESFKLTLPGVDKASKYHVEIYKEKSAKTLIYAADSNSPEVIWTTKRAGVFFFRFKVYDPKNRESSYSPIAKIIFPISPLSDWENKE
jgi:hypothetical protein